MIVDPAVLAAVVWIFIITITFHLLAMIVKIGMNLLIPLGTTRRYQSPGPFSRRRVVVIDAATGAIDG